MEYKSIYIKKIWNLEQLKSRFEKLKKIIPQEEIIWQIQLGRTMTSNELDALYIAYYNLKDRYSKLERKAFGVPSHVYYKSKYDDFREKMFESEIHTTNSYYWGNHCADNYIFNAPSRLSTQTISCDMVSPIVNMSAPVWTTYYTQDTNTVTNY